MKFQAVFIASAFGVVAALPAPAATVDFKRDVQPIFEQRCVECHGEKKQKSGVRLDKRSGAFGVSDSGKPAIVPGKSAESLLVQRIITDQEEEVMPPKGGKLTAEQVATLRAWIDAGAAWPEAEERRHWSYEKPVLERGTRNAERGNPIDGFVRARLAKEGLKPSPKAERATLIRRVSLDVIGLPPTLAEVEAFVNDKSPNAFEKVVDRLLASPRYGERWARPWLDMARYADTQGYEKDNRRSVWPYRDWVIRALNTDMPFDQFTIEQIAGDLLPDATQDQKTATGFHRNTMTNTEGGTDDEEFRYEAMVDRVNTTWAVWMGSTFNCAQCHNHKSDPFSTREYYEFMAFLNSTADSDKDNEAPTMKVFKPGQEAQLAKLRDETKGAEKMFTGLAARPEIAQAQQAWEQKTIAGLTNWTLLDPTNFVSAGGATLTKPDGKSIQAGGENPTNDTYTVTASFGPGRLGAVRLEVLESGERKSLGRHENGGFVLAGFELSANGKRLGFKRAAADFSQKNFEIENVLTGRGDGWAVATFEEKNKGVRRSAWFALSNTVEFKEPVALTLTLRHSDRHPLANIERFRLSTAANADAASSSVSPSNEVRTILLTAADKRDKKQARALREHFQSIAPELKQPREAMAAAKKAEKEYLDAIPVTSVMEERKEPRVTKRHVRGAYLNTAEEVTPGTPATMHPFPAGTPTNRLGLARWIVSTNNPLTARVVVNRYWEQLFGKGIVETMEEFGKQGEPPSHPELLDWLAWEFMAPLGRNDERASGSSFVTRHSPLPPRPWSMKALLRTLVMSETYQQSSRVTPELLAKDPFNRLLARGPRVRLEGEMVRDQALAVSGLLSPKLGGPSVMPPQPDGVWQVVYSGDKWETSKGEDKYRRGLYTFWRRSMPHPMMTSFDAPSREFCVLRRSRSNTPLQALNILNDPAFVECAQALARKASKEQGGVRGRVEFLFRTCLSRAPSKAEVARLSKLYEEQLANYRGEVKAAVLMAGGETDAAELAAWTVVANVLLNLDEMITKG